MNIRVYRAEDKENCLAIFLQNMGHSFTQEDLPFFNHWLDNHEEYPYFVVEDDKGIIACGGIYYDDRYDMAGLSWGMVAPEYQNQGIGKMFTKFRIEQIKKVFPETGCFIETTQHSAGFYVKLGFEVKSFQRNGYDKGTDKYVLEYAAA